MVAIHHVGCSIGQQHAIRLTNLAENTFVGGEFTLCQLSTPQVAKPRIDVLQVQGAASEKWIRGVDDTNPCARTE